MGEIYKELFRAQHGEMVAMQSLLERFRPLIRKFARYLRTEDAEQDLGLALIVLVLNLHIDELKSTNDAVLLAYFKRALQRSYIALAKKERKYRDHITFLSDLSESVLLHIEVLTATTDQYFNNDFIFVRAYLTEHEMMVLKEVVLMDRKVSDLAKELGVSRQTINATKLRAVKKLRNAKEWR